MQYFDFLEHGQMFSGKINSGERESFPVAVLRLWVKIALAHGNT